MRSYFLNISNHPSRNWDDEQLSEAMKYGEIVDIPFPDIDPNFDKFKIKEMAERMFNNILNSYSEKEITVHVMGELTFCYSLVSMLERVGIRCLASCSYRNTIVCQEGKKLSVFRFVRFREY